MSGATPLIDLPEPAHWTAPLADGTFNDEFIGSAVSVGAGNGSLGYLNNLSTACQVYRGQVPVK